MSGQSKVEDIQLLAKMAARLAGRDPDDRITVKIGSLVAFDDVAWRYPDFLQRAEQAYTLLGGPGPSAANNPSNKE